MSAAVPKGHTPHSFEVPLYPRSASVLLDMLEQYEQLPSMATLPGYVLIDVANFTNQLRAHLQRVAIGV